MADEKKDQKQTKKGPAAGKPAAGSEQSRGKPAAGSEQSRGKPAAGEKPAGAKRGTRAGASKPASGAKRRAPARSKRGAGSAKAETKAKTKAEAPKDEAAVEQPEAKQPARRPSSPREAQKRRDRSPAPARPVVFARAKYVRSSARKARLVLEHVRGKSIADARAVLRHSPRGVARDLERLLDSAVANAENNHDLVGDDLLVKEAYADEGPTLKRFRPRAQGRAYRIRKRTSHLTMSLTPKE
jgi:ribosomal protein L22